MDSHNHHSMYLDRELPDGTQEWVCPTCGRRIIMQWPPLYQRIVLVPGDETVPHSGAMTSASLGLPKSDVFEKHVIPVESLDLPVELEDENKVDPYLLPWLEWVERKDF